MKKYIISFLLTIVVHRASATSPVSDLGSLSIRTQDPSLEIFRIDVAQNCDDQWKTAVTKKGHAGVGFAYRCQSQEKVVSVEIKAASGPVISFSLKIDDLVRIDVPFKNSVLSIQSY